MSDLTLDALTHKVLTYFQRHGRRYQFTPANVRVFFEAEQSGMDLCTYTIAEGSHKLTLKLGLDESTQVSLERWAYLTRRLCPAHHAPAMVDWIEIPGVDVEGLLYEQPAGQPLDLVQHPEALKQVLAALVELHHDQGLANDLKALNAQDEADPEDERPADLPYENLDCFLDGFIGQFDGDLVEIAENFPEFLSHEVDDWMMGETRELEGLAREMPSFEDPAETPVQGSLYPDSLRFDDEGHWTALAWESVGLGDPAMDYALLLGALWREGAMSIEEAAALIPQEETSERGALIERFKLYLRAILLEEIIDSAASWVETEDFPVEKRTEIRGALEAAHLKALALYKKVFG